MKAVIETRTFLACAREVGLADDERKIIVDTIAADPGEGEMMQGTGGCLKRRFAGRGKGKRGGYRTIHYNGADDVPVLLMVVLDKGDRDNISQGERNELRKLVKTYEDEYRAAAAAKAQQMKKLGA